MRGTSDSPGYDSLDVERSGVQEDGKEVHDERKICIGKWRGQCNPVVE